MFGNTVGKQFARALLAAAIVVAAPALAAESVPVYQAMFKAYPAPALEQVQGREYKFLIDPAQIKPRLDEAFADIWQQVLRAAELRGFKVTQKEKDAFKIDFSTKEYLDTPDQALWKAGYLVRISTRYSGDQPESNVSVTIKSVNRDTVAVLARPLTVVGVEKFKTEAEDGIGFFPGGRLGQYIEKGSSFTVPAAALRSRTLGDFGKYVPELLKLGLPADTRLAGITAYSYRVKPGAVVLPEVGPCGVSMEAWSKSKGGAPYLYDFSFAYGDIDFYAVGEAHAVGERFLDAVFGDQLYRLQPANGEKWGGSKVRLLMNRPL
jgi:hypothetical protein